MAHKNILEAIDRSFKDIMQCDEPFGGKTLVLAGDFRQVLPVIPHAGRRDVVEAALNQSSLWKHIAVFHLKTNERIKRMKKLHPNINAAKLKKFADDLEKIGDGTYPTHEELGENVIRIPDHWLSKSETIDEFIHEIFPAVKSGNAGEDCKNAILTTTNEEADKINDKIMSKMSGVAVELPSIDENVPTNKRCKCEVKHLNAMTPSGAPPHLLRLKKNAIIILLRNLDPANGACNGTRLKVQDFTKYIIDAKTLCGPRKNQHLFIHRIRSILDKDKPNHSFH